MDTYLTKGLVNNHIKQQPMRTSKGCAVLASASLAIHTIDGTWHAVHISSTFVLRLSALFHASGQQPHGSKRLTQRRWQTPPEQTTSCAGRAAAGASRSRCSRLWSMASSVASSPGAADCEARSLRTSGRRSSGACDAVHVMRCM